MPASMPIQRSLLAVLIGIISSLLAARLSGLSLAILICVSLASIGLTCAPLALRLLHPKPRLPYPSEKKFIYAPTNSHKNPSNASPPSTLPCWFDAWLADDRHLQSQNFHIGEFYVPESEPLEAAELQLSVVFPAYNEEERILPTLTEAVAYLDRVYGRHKVASSAPPNSTPMGYEIIIVDDGSKDTTVATALKFAAENNLGDSLRIVRLAKNRGKGGAVTHGFRHVRGAHVLFADADGATKFSDLEKLVQAVEKVVDGANRGIAIGSRARLVKNPEILKRSALRNFLMRCFHFVLTILTPAATSRIKDTQCGFKLFTRAALPHIVPYMRTEGWIFDIEMLMLAESSPPAPITAPDDSVIGTTQGIRVAEVPVNWHEVSGSKVNVVKDSIKMGWGLAVLRLSWTLGVYSRRELRT
ncbi:Dolichyl-phosphate beta-glucosyltransferase [Ceratocystis fimbriata CBS 114723]|uniref:dolichyl-phosphate beta-glucosyltransferase n=1 Tax=Ceratocystis fimbriata CBS 114723 TaxID=1035309 RepID=A0A2C5XIR2_9PEZI|nr:Dolichyl-phosphate beta-glucosyltransferase [Ceratocystis fimbriata CBS 114723]